MFAHSTVAYLAFSRRVQLRTKLLPSLRQVLSQGHNTLRGHSESILQKAHALNFQGALAVIRDRAAALRSLQHTVLISRAKGQTFAHAVAACNGLAMTGVFLARRALASATMAYVEVFHRAQFIRKLVPALRRVLDGWHITSRRCYERILEKARALNVERALAVIRHRAATLRSLQHTALITRAKRQTFSHAVAAYNSLAMTGVFLARRTLASATMAYDEAFHRAQLIRKHVPALRRVLEGWHITSRRYYERILEKARALNVERALAVIRHRAAALRSLQQIALTRAKRPLLSYSVSDRSLERTVVLSERRMYGYATAAAGFSKRIQISRPGLQKSLEDVQVILRCTQEIIFKELNFRAALLRKRAAMLPSLSQVAQSNIFFGVLVVVLLVGTTISITKIVHRDAATFATRQEEDTNPQSQAQPGHISKQNPGKRRPRTGRHTPPENKRDWILKRK
jgi:acetolactate synthase regulatory subunit